VTFPLVAFCADALIENGDNIVGVTIKLSVRNKIPKKVILDDDLLSITTAAIPSLYKWFNQEKSICQYKIKI
jgi:hypothetical protein